MHFNTNTYIIWLYLEGMMKYCRYRVTHKQSIKSSVHFHFFFVNFSKELVVYCFTSVSKQLHSYGLKIICKLYKSKTKKSFSFNNKLPTFFGTHISVVGFWCHMFENTKPLQRKKLLPCKRDSEWIYYLSRGISE